MLNADFFSIEKINIIQKDQPALEIPPLTKPIRCEITRLGDQDMVEAFDGATVQSDLITPI